MQHIIVTGTQHKVIGAKKLICGPKVLLKQCMYTKGEPKTTEGTKPYTSLQNDCKTVLI